MSSRFNVGVAAALVLGGIAALLLATALALGGYGRSGGRATSPGAAHAASGVASSVPDIEFEYVPDTSDSAATTEQRTP